MKRDGLIPRNADPVKLADRMKRGMSKKFLRDLEELRKANYKYN